VGNVSVDVLSRGTTEQTRQEVRRCLRDGSPGGGYMISSGHCFPLLNMLLPNHSIVHAISLRTGKNGEVHALLSNI